MRVHISQDPHMYLIFTIMGVVWFIHISQPILLLNITAYTSLTHSVTIVTHKFFPSFFLFKHCFRWKFFIAYLLQKKAIYSPIWTPSEISNQSFLLTPYFRFDFFSSSDFLSLLLFWIRILLLINNDFFQFDFLSWMHTFTPAKFGMNSDTINPSRREQSEWFSIWPKTTNEFLSLLFDMLQLQNTKSHKKARINTRIAFIHLTFCSNDYPKINRCDKIR